MPTYKGKSLEEALENASIEENVDPQYLNYFIDKQTDEEVIIFTYFYSDIISFASQYVRKILEDLNIKVEIKTSFDNSVIKLRLTVSENSLLIGRDGVTLQALTVLTRAAVAQEFKRHFHLLIDVNSYKQRKYDRLIRIASQLAREVMDNHQEAVLEPMTSDERRVIHNELSKFDKIVTESRGEGHARRIVIKYVAEGRQATTAVIDEVES